MAQSNSHPSRTRLMTTFAGVALGVLIITVLYFAQTIFIPVALAVFLSFLMAPVVGRLERWIGRVVAVVVTVLAATGLLVGIGWAVTHEVGGLVQTLNQPQYAANISEKVQLVQRWLQGGIVKEFEGLTRKVEQQVRQGGRQGGTDELPK